MKTQAQFTREYNEMAVTIGEKEITRLRSSPSQSIEDKVEAMMLRFNIWEEENEPAEVKTVSEQENKVEPSKVKTITEKKKESRDQEKDKTDLVKRVSSSQPRIKSMNENKNYRAGSAKEIVYSCMHEGDLVSCVILEAGTLGLTNTQAKQAFNNIIYKDNEGTIS